MKNLRAIFFEHLGQTSPEPLALEIVKAEGVKLFDIHGKEYFDLIAGVSVANLGHKNDFIIDAIKNQADKYLHLMVYGELIQEPQVLLAEKLASILPEQLNSTYFLNSGSEAIEGAMKIAKRFTGRSEIIACKNAYHGSTQGALSLISDPILTAAYRPLLPDIKHINFNSFDDIKLITSSTACVIIEPIQGEAGIILPKENYLKKLREQCDKTETLLIFDEIQTGFGRTGKMFAFENYEVIPDILVLAKALGAGLPLGAFVSSQKIMNSFTNNPALGHITTFGGHPLSCAAGLAGLNLLISNEKLINSVVEKEELLLKILSKSKLFKDIRSKGLLMAVDMGSNDKLFKILPILYENGIHTDWFLFNNQSFRISPPLTITNSELEEAAEKILFSINK